MRKGGGSPGPDTDKPVVLPGRAQRCESLKFLIEPFGNSKLERAAVPWSQENGLISLLGMVRSTKRARARCPCGMCV